MINMKIKYIIITNLILFSYLGFCSAQETLTVTTYYPAPYGIYDALQLQPNDTVPACEDLATDMGKLHYDNGLGQGLPGGAELHICNHDGGTGVKWDTIPVGGSLGKWTYVDRGANDDTIYPDSMEWVVGMGTDVPGKHGSGFNSGVRLHIVDSNTILDVNDRVFCNPCTSAVIEGRSGAILHIASEDSGSIASQLVLSGVDTDDSDGLEHNHWILFAYGPNQNNRFSISHLTSSGDFDVTDSGVTDYFNLHIDGRTEIPDTAQLDLNLYYDEDTITGGSLAAVEAEAKCQVIQSGSKDVPFIGGCDCSTGNSAPLPEAEHVQIRESYPSFNLPNDAGRSGWHCECYSHEPAAGQITTKAWVYCADMYRP